MQEKLNFINKILNSFDKFIKKLTNAYGKLLGFAIGKAYKFDKVSLSPDSYSFSDRQAEEKLFSDAVAKVSSDLEELAKNNEIFSAHLELVADVALAEGVIGKIAEGKNVGTSLVEDDKLDLAKDLLAKSNGKIVLPIDTVVASEFKNDAEYSTVDVDNIPNDKMGLDIGEKTVTLFDSYIKTAKTVVWNGPMGVFEMSNFAKGTIGVCESIASLTDAVTIIGGGDSAAAAISLGYADKFTHISTGGGASLEFLEGKVLPGVEAISNK